MPDPTPATIANALATIIRGVSDYGREVLIGDLVLPTYEDFDEAGWQDTHEMAGGRPRHRFWKVYWTGRSDVRGPSTAHRVPLQRVHRTYNFVCECLSSFDETVDTQDGFYDMVDRVMNAIDNEVRLGFTEGGTVRTDNLVCQMDSIIQEGDFDMHHAIITLDVLVDTGYSPT